MEIIKRKRKYLSFVKKYNLQHANFIKWHFLSNIVEANGKQCGRRPIICLGLSKKVKKQNASHRCWHSAKGVGPVTVIFHKENDTGRGGTVDVGNVPEGTRGFLQQQHCCVNTASRVK